MKKVYLILMIVGTLFACSKDDEPTKSSLASIDDLKIEFKDVDAKAVQMEGLGTENITVSVPFGTDLKGKVTVKVSQKATVTPVSGTEVTFVDGKAQDFVVKAEDGTVKIYKVTVNVRGEVGSGTKVKSISIDQGWAVDKFEFTYNDKTNFVTTYTSYGTTDTYTYDAKNQITEKKNDKTITTYKYKDGLIVSAEEKNVKDSKLKYSYKYEYANDKLVKIERTDSENKTTVQKFKIDDKGNTVSYTTGTQEFENEFDAKKNPMKGIYPTAFSKISAGKGLVSVNMNNVIKSGIVEYKYVYNKADYPESASYEIWGMAVKVEYKYFD